YSTLYSLRVLGYCLMSNHVHLIVVPTDARSMSRALREVSGHFAQYRNAIDRTSGHVWQNRYYSCPFEPSRLAAVMRYVERNPVRGGSTRSPGDYCWSSAASHLGGGDATGLLDLDAWFREWTAEGWSAVLQEGREEAAAIRQATYAGRPLGPAKFIAALEGQLQRKLTPGKSGRPKSAAAA
ncbi:MAG: transposase, partial [Bryobacteraceae bacterium]